MTAEPLPVYQERWGLTDETHEAVLEELQDGYDGFDLVSLDRTFRELGLDEYQGPEVTTPEYMKALREVDNRKWHDRGVDALTQFHMQTFDQSDFDLMLREQDYNYTDSNTDYSREDAHRNKKGYPKGDLDFARISLRDDHILMEVWEIKTHEEDLEKSGQIDKHFRIKRQFEQAKGIPVKLRDHELSAKDIQEKMEVTQDEYGIPRKYWGDTYVSDGSEQQVRESERLETFQDKFLGEQLDLENIVEEVERQEEFLS
ncbi:MAG: hypothetical protein ABEJ36_05750 [Candidatus Nanosalina sp.]